ncbi:MAG: 23S rRNA pseudouridine(1911/1915/1917) synthase RluD [Gammaproteobacteria bacterium]|nr:23S rRNA pseudouridine(1911/1915/1917) synthase RluD [Gammaproteobacteria bacterium]
MLGKIELSGEVPEDCSGRRLDQVLAELFPDYSRSRLQQWVRNQQVLLNGKPAVRPKDKVKGGEAITIDAEIEEEVHCEPEPIDLDVVYEDDSLLIINKPVGLVVHPGAGHSSGTLQNALLHHDAALAGVPRAGIVHRLDKDTSGLLMVARTLLAHNYLVQQLQARDIEREYEALVSGVMPSGGTVDAPIGRHPVERKRMSVVEGGRESVTHYRVVERYRAHSRLRLRLESGRTHQIRVHMMHIHYPMLGDMVYGGRLRQPKGASDELRQALQHFRHQALHATRLALIHPVTGEGMEWNMPVPADMQEMIEVLRRDFEVDQ